jgi:hypothetical protein
MNNRCQFTAITTYHDRKPLAVVMFALPVRLASDPA